MRILAIDYGETRTGLAACDPTELLVSPVLPQIVEKSINKVADEICRRAAEMGAGMLVLGLPRNMDGTEGPRAQLCRAFAQTLREATGLEVDLWDERRTTVEAHNILSQHNYHGKKRKNTVDAVAASLILEGYLAYLRR